MNRKTMLVAQSLIMEMDPEMFSIKHIDCPGQTYQEDEWITCN